MFRPILFSSLLLITCCVLLPTCSCAQGGSVARVFLSTSAVSEPPAGPAQPKLGPLSLAVGTWTGQLSTPASVLNMGLTIGEQGNSFTALLDIPGGTVRQRRLVVNQRADTLRLVEFTLDTRLTCSVSADGQSLAVFCTWPSLGLRQPLVFHRGTPPAAGPAGQRVNRVPYETKWENGTLENNRPVGVWNYYQKDDAGDYVLIRSYDHSARQLTFARPESQPFDAEVQPGVWERTILTQAPWFVGPHDALSNLGSQLKYPADAKARHIEGKVWVTFAVDTLGRVSDHKILKGLGGGCDEEALRIARSIPDTWTPARLGNKAVACRNTLMFAFKL